jgi:hypothetical protein
MRGFSILMVGLVLASCTQDHLFKNPTTGDIVTCGGGWQYGLAGMLVQQDQGACDDRMWREGYERLPPRTTLEQARATSNR